MVRGRLAAPQCRCGEGSIAADAGPDQALRLGVTNLNNTRNPTGVWSARLDWRWRNDIHYCAIVGRDLLHLASHQQ